jgi:N-acylneuraminate cytidylyltransferase
VDGMVGRPNAEGVLAIVTARGGSKGIPKKNIKDVAGHPLIAYSVAAGMEAETVDRVIASTDDSEIAEIARAYGAEIPFMRPAELAADDTRDLPVFQHALEWLEKQEGYVPSIVVHLRPTSPLRQIGDIDRAVRMLRDPKYAEADAVRGVCQPFQNPYKMWRLDGDGFMTALMGHEMQEPYNQPHQALPPVYWQTGYIDVVRATTIRTLGSMTGRRIAPLVLDHDSWIDIDTPEALRYADYLLRKGVDGVAVPRRADGRH